MAWVNLEWAGCGDAITSVCVPPSVQEEDSCVVDLQELVFQALHKAGALEEDMLHVPAHRVRLFDAHNQELTSRYFTLDLRGTESMLNFDEFLTKASAWKRWVKKLGSPDAERCVLGVTWYGPEVTMLTRVLMKSAEVKLLWLFAAHRLNEQHLDACSQKDRSSETCLAKVSSPKLLILRLYWLGSGVNLPSIIMPVGTCVVDVQWLVYTQCVKFGPRAFASPVHVRLHDTSKCRRLSMLSYENCDAVFPAWHQWESSSSEAMMVSSYTAAELVQHGLSFLDVHESTQQSHSSQDASKEDVSKEQVTNQEAQTQKAPTQGSSFNHAVLKELYSQYKASLL